MRMIPADPIAEIVAERERARAAGDPLADVCLLATSGGVGAPGVRPLILRDVGPDGVGLLVSATSPKWEPLRGGRYEGLLLWTSVRRQYRVRGGLAPMPEPLVERYWSQKVHESRLLDVYYETAQPQSSVVASHEAFRSGIEALRARHPTPDAVPRPPLLRGVYLVPFRVEVWHGALDRLHDRRAYVKTPAGWRVDVLVP
ncbi:MAG TPA: pyridoxine 5'-phosphate oxidase C-terminal domain-containing protein [Methylomirabilota bacterium]|nr:pyridoxine 5'-phosphate oxidase C-terminal domain-containing protein [Methylomirabilota bacterium]